MSIRIIEKREQALSKIESTKLLLLRVNSKSPTRRRSVLLGFSILIVSTLLNVGCVSYKIRYGTFPKIETGKVQNIKPIKTYSISSIFTDCGAFDTVLIQRIKQELSALNFERYNDTDTSTSAKVKVFSEVKNAIIKKPKMFGWKMMPYWLTLGVLPGGQNTVTNPTFSLQITDGTKVNIAKGEMINDSNIYFSVWSPLGLINWGGKSNKYNCVNQIKGSSVGFGFLLKNRFKLMAYQINAIIDNYENQNQ